jgi:sugar (pentulose or hexulose) kinase
MDATRLHNTHLLAVDLGTTHVKAGLFAGEGTSIATAGRPTPTRTHAAGWSYYDPEELWAGVVATMVEVLRSVSVPPGCPPPCALGITSMAESGVLLDRATGKARSPFLPWFDRAAQPQGEFISRQGDALQRFRCTGIRAGYKCGLAKVLWLEEREPGITRGTVWLSAADYVAWRLTGQMATDYSLAARTAAFCIGPKRWDAPWVAQFGLDAALFPPARPAGEVVGRLLAEPAARLSLPAGLPVSIAGHDHLSAALALGVGASGRVLDSLGTAESLVGALPERQLGDQEYASGLTYGPHALPGRYFWMGAQPASGGSLEWLRRQLGQETLSYDELAALAPPPGAGPTDLLFLPYLLGRQVPQLEPGARGALVGLSASHGRADLVQAVLQGTAYEMELIRRTAERTNGVAIGEIVATGGGTRFPGWLQLRADVSGCRFLVSSVAEAALLGAALLAGVVCGLYPDVATAQQAAAALPAETLLPDPARHTAHVAMLEQHYLPLAEALGH